MMTRGRLSGCAWLARGVVDWVRSGVRRGVGRALGEEGRRGRQGTGGRWSRHTTCLALLDRRQHLLVDAYTRMLSKWNDADAKIPPTALSDRSDKAINNILAGHPSTRTAPNLSTPSRGV